MYDRLNRHNYSLIMPSLPSTSSFRPYGSLCSPDDMDRVQASLQDCTRQLVDVFYPGSQYPDVQVEDLPHSDDQYGSY